jgi:hypothetical protein
MIMRSKKLLLTAQARAVLATIAYTDQFSYPLTLEEIKQRLLFLPPSLTKKKQRVESLTTSLRSLKKDSLIGSTTDPRTHVRYFFLPGRELILQTRVQREHYAARKAAELDLILDFVRRIPWVQEVYVTGSQAMNTADLESDIDFMFITEPNRLWLTRILVSLFAQIQGKRRSWNHEEPGSWCFNLWLDSDHLTVRPELQDPYRAYEVLQAKLLWAKKGREYTFAHQNSWIKTFLPLATFKKKNFPSPSSAYEKNKFWDGLDWLAWQFQSWYMKRHRTTEKVGRGYAFFHPRDTGRVVTDGWVQSLQQCLPKSQALEILQPYVGRISTLVFTSSRHSSKA